MKGIRNIGTFITADALLAAVLLVWGQLWRSPAIELFGRQYKGPGPDSMPPWFDDFNLNLGVGLVMTYSAVFLALLALAWVSWRSRTGQICDTPRTALGLFAASLTIAIINVTQSVSTVSMKLLPLLVKERLIYEPLTLGCFFMWSTYGLILAIIGLSIWGAHTFDKYKSGCKYLLPWKIEATIIGIAGEFGLCLLRGTLKDPHWLILMLAFGIVASAFLIWLWFFMKKSKAK